MGFLAPTVKTSVSVGKTSEFSATNSEYGLDIPIGFGTDRFLGNMVWWSDIRLTKSTDTQTQGGKGGPKQQTTTTTYQYFVDVDFVFAAGQAETLLRIWADGKVIYDARGVTVEQSDNLTFRFYNGSEDQLPDALIEAAEGENNVSAQRGLVHIVFENLDLSDFGNRIPAISAEINFGEQGADIIPSAFTSVDLQADGNALLNDFTNTVLVGLDGKIYWQVESGTSDRIFRADRTVSGLSNVEEVTSSVSSQFGVNAATLHGANESGVIFSKVFETTAVSSRYYNWNGVIYEMELNGGTGKAALVPGSNWAMMGSNASAAFPAANQTLMLNLDALVAGDPDRNISAQFFSIARDPFSDGGAVISGKSGECWDFYQSSSTQIRVNVGTPTGITQLVTINVTDIVPGDTAWSTSTSTSDQIFGVYDPVRDRLLLSKLTAEGSIPLWAVNRDGSLTVLQENLPVKSPANSGSGTIAGGSVLTGNTLIMADVSGNVVRIFLADGTIDTNFNGTGNQLLFEEDGVTRLTVPGTSDDIGAVSVIMWDEENATLWAQTGANSGNISSIHTYNFSLAEGEDINPQKVVASLCEDAGLAASEYDVSALPVSAQGVKSLRRDSRQSYGDIIENLLDLLSYTVVEVDGALTFREKGQPSSVTVPEDDLVVSGNNQGETFARSIIREKDLPRVYEVNYRDSQNNYQDNVQRDQRPGGPVTSVVSDNIETFTYSGAGQADAFQAAAVRDLYAAWAEIDRLSYRLPQKYMGVTATDTITLDLGSTTFKGRVRSSDLGSNFTTDIEKVIEVDGQYTVVGVGDGGEAFDRVIPNTGPTTAILLNLPLLFDVDTEGQDVSVFYWGGAGETTWPGCVLYQQEGSSLVNEIGTSLAEFGLGTTVTAVPDPVTTTRFEPLTQTFDFSVQFGLDQFESTTIDNVLAGANTLAVVKANGDVELIQFTTMELVSSNVVRVSGLLRGRRGTEPYATGHLIGEQVVLLGFNSTQITSNARTSIGSEFDYVAPTIGQLFEEALGFTFTPTGEDLKPYSPVQVEVTNPGTPDGLDLSWVRRTRIGGELMDGVDVPLSEQSENYEVDILDGPGGTVLRTLMSTTENVNYSNADITTDFGTLPATLDVVVYQISDAVGRGKPAIASLET